ncbi:hypothetical protein CANTEDRAFT_113186, partial [Yamadazyma tenuis ATCC 10573]
MPSLSYFLDSIDSSCQRIEELQFRPPGMFTNAIVTKPDITQLLKDANPSESLLYRVTNPVDGSIIDRPAKLLVRVDGKSYFEDDNGEEYSNHDVSSNKIRRVAVNVPRLVANSAQTTSGASSDMSSSPVKASAQITEAASIYRSLIEYTNKLPVANEEFILSIRAMKEEYEQFSGQLQGLQQEYDEQQKLLQSHNVFGLDGVSEDV